MTENNQNDPMMNGEPEANLNDNQQVAPVQTDGGPNNFDPMTGEPIKKKRPTMAIVSVIGVVLIILAACFYFMRSNPIEGTWVRKEDQKVSDLSQVEVYVEIKDMTLTTYMAGEEGIDQITMSTPLEKADDKYKTLNDQLTLGVNIKIDGTVKDLSKEILDDKDLPQSLKDWYTKVTKNSDKNSHMLTIAFTPELIKETENLITEETAAYLLLKKPDLMWMAYIAALLNNTDEFVLPEMFVWEKDGVLYYKDKPSSADAGGLELYPYLGK